MTGRGVQASHRATHHIHKRLQVIIHPLDQVVLDRITLDKVIFEDGVCPDTELGTALGFDPVAYGDDDVEVIEYDYMSVLWLESHPVEW